MGSFNNLAPGCPCGCGGGTPCATITVTVLGCDGLPYQGEVVSFTQGGAGLADLSDASGLVSYTTSAPGAWLVAADAQGNYGGISQTVTVVCGTDQSITLQLLFTAPLFGSDPFIGTPEPFNYVGPYWETPVRSGVYKRFYLPSAALETYTTLGGLANTKTPNAGGHCTGAHLTFGYGSPAYVVFST